MSIKDYLVKMIRVVDCEYIPQDGKDCPAYVSFILEFPKGFQLYTDNENLLKATINVSDSDNEYDED